jgi:hypothetical protein
VIARVATAVPNRKISAECRREYMLVRETDGGTLPFLKAKHALRHEGILIPEVGEDRRSIWANAGIGSCEKIDQGTVLRDRRISVQCKGDQSFHVSNSATRAVRSLTVSLTRSSIRFVGVLRLLPRLRNTRFHGAGLRDRRTWREGVLSFKQR